MCSKKEIVGGARKVAAVIACCGIVPLVLPFVLAVEIEKHTSRKPVTHLLDELGKM